MLFFVLLHTCAVTGNNRKIRGIVTTADGKPAVSATVMLKTTRYGTTTETDGSYSLDAPEGTLYASHSIRWARNQNHPGSGQCRRNCNDSHHNTQRIDQTTGRCSCHRTIPTAIRQPVGLPDSHHRPGTDSVAGRDQPDRRPEQRTRHPVFQRCHARNVRYSVDGHVGSERKNPARRRSDGRPGRHPREPESDRHQHHRARRNCGRTDVGFVRNRCAGWHYQHHHQKTGQRAPHGNGPRSGRNRCE
jgi:hypothetical protein